MGKIDKRKEELETLFPHASINRKPFGDTFHAKKKLIGGYLDRKLVDLASLYCVYSGVSKTDLITELIQNKSKEFPSEKQMMDGICKQQLDQWIQFVESQDIEEGIQYHYRKKKLWSSYKERLIKELNKIIPKFYTNYVIDYIEEAQF
jgi:hypothetical protein